MSRKNELLLISEAYAKVNEGLDGRGDETTTVNDGPGESLELQPNSEGKLYYPGDPSNPDNNKQQENAEEEGKKVYVLWDTTQYELNVLGIYSTLSYAQEALKMLEQEDPSDRGRFEVKEVSMDKSPDSNFITH